MVVRLADGLHEVDARSHGGGDVGLGLHHEERGGNPLAAHVRNQKAQLVVAHPKEVVEVTTHVLRGVHAGVYVKRIDAGDWWKRAR